MTRKRAAVSAPYKLDNGRWRVRWRTPEGVSRMRSFDRKVDAETFLTSVRHDKLTGNYVDYKAGAVTFKDFAEQWRTIQQHRPSTSEAIEINLRRHVYPTFGRRQLNNIRPSELQSWVKSLESKLAPATIETIARHVIAIFKAAIRDQLISKSPAEGIKLPKVAKVEVVPLEVAQVLQIAETIQSRFSALVMLMATTGLRPGEAFGLTADRVEFLKKTLRVDRQMVTVGGVASFGEPKTAASVRTIPLPTFTLEALSEHIREYELGEDGLIFTDGNSDAIKRNRFGDVWRSAMGKLDFECKGPHQLRHHYASLLIRHGESVKVVQSRLGHSSATETLDTYAHLWPDSEESTRAAVEGAYSLSVGVVGVLGGSP